jgi:hypothetical protein
MSKRRGGQYTGGSSVFDWRTFGYGHQSKHSEEARSRDELVERLDLEMDSYIETIHPTVRAKLLKMPRHERTMAALHHKHHGPLMQKSMWTKLRKKLCAVVSVQDAPTSPGTKSAHERLSEARYGNER